MSSDEDSAWLEALAGRTDGSHSATAPTDAAVGNAPPRALVLEALALREFIQAQQLDSASLVPSTDAAREAELIQRARAAGVLPGNNAPPLAGGAAASRRPWFASRLTFAAAATVLGAIGVSLWRSTLPPVETLRGAANGIVHLVARDPPALKRQLTEELNAVGVRVSGYERLGHIGIDADLPQPVPAQVAAVLERHHIPTPADGALVVEIDAPAR